MSAEPTDVGRRALGRQLESIGEAIKRLDALAQQSSEPQSSVELVQNAKGARQIAFKVYHREAEQAATKAQRLYDELASRYSASVLGSRQERGMSVRPTFGGNQPAPSHAPIAGTDASAVARRRSSVRITAELICLLCGSPQCTLELGAGRCRCQSRCT